LLASVAMVVAFVRLLIASKDMIASAESRKVRKSVEAFAQQPRRHVGIFGN
jgi:hypothetical protein